MFYDFEGSRLHERVGRDDDSIDPVIFENVSMIFVNRAEHRLAPESQRSVMGGIV